MISTRQQVAIAHAALRGIEEGRARATTTTTAGDAVGNTISKEFRTSVRHIVACDRRDEPAKWAGVREAGRRVGEAAGSVDGLPLVLLSHDRESFSLEGSVVLVCGSGD